jgi:hypothetical protein
MRAVLSEAFFADHRIIRWRFVAMIAALALVVTVLAASSLSNMRVEGGGPLVHALPVLAAAITGLVFFAVLLATAAPLWWLLWRQRWRGWASSMIAGAVLFAALAFAELFAMVGLATPSALSGAALGLLVGVLVSAAFGVAFGWIVWRVAVRPALPPTEAFD